MNLNLNLGTLRQEVKDITQRLPIPKNPVKKMKKEWKFLSKLAKPFVMFLFSEIENELDDFKRFRVNYFRLHVAYFVIISLLGSVVFLWHAPNTPYIDAIFTAVSSMTGTGLSVLDVWNAPPSTIWAIMVLSILGSTVLTSLWPVVLRRIYFEKYVKERNPGIHQIERKLPGKLKWEYLALKVLIVAVPMYLFVIILVCSMILWVYFIVVPTPYFEAEGVSRGMFSIFVSVCAFTNAGFSLFPDNVIPLDHDPFPLIIIGTLIIVGNVGYPMFFRFWLWAMYKGKKKDPAIKFLMRHPRRCFTHLFPPIETRWLLATFVAFFVLQYVVFLLQDWNLPGFISGNVTSGQRLAIIFFQSAATRAGGMNAVDLTTLNPSLLTLYAGLMYVSAYPVAITLRATSKNEVSATGDDDDEDPEGDEEIFNASSSTSSTSRLGFQTKRLLARDVTFVFGMLFVILWIEAERMANDPANFTIFSVAFEVISAYANCGYTLGYSGTDLSLSAMWHWTAKLILIGVMLIGRHRGLPEGIDASVTVRENMILLGHGEENTTTANPGDMKHPPLSDDEHDSHSEVELTSISDKSSLLAGGATQRQYRSTEQAARATGDQTPSEYVNPFLAASPSSKSVSNLNASSNPFKDAQL